MDELKPVIRPLLTFTGSIGSFEKEIKDTHDFNLGLKTLLDNRIQILQVSSLVAIATLGFMARSQYHDYAEIIAFVSIIWITANVLFINYDFYMKHHLGEKEQGYLNIPQEIIKEKVRVWILKILLVRILLIIFIYRLLLLFPDIWWILSPVLSFLFFAIFNKQLFRHDLIFPKIEKFPDGELKDKLYKFCTGKVDKSNIFLWKFSQYTKRVNAGVFKIKRKRSILLGDNLFENFDDDEINAMLAHELAHLELRHIEKKILLIIFSLTFIVGIVNLLLNWYIDYFGIPKKASMISLVFIYTVYFILSRFHVAISLLYSRYAEKKADEWALRYFPKRNSFESMLVRLHLTNGIYHKNSLREKLQFLTHPPVEDRIKHLRMYAEKIGIVK